MIKQFKFYLMALWGLLVFSYHAAAGGTSGVGGLGIYWVPDNTDGYPRVTNVVMGLPAEQIHLQADDHIIRVGDQSTKDLSTDTFNALIKGPVGSKCVITVLRGNFEYPVSFIRAPFYPEWQAGATDDFYHIKANVTPGTWNSYPGYQFLNPGRSGDFRTVWKPGTIHPFYKVRACNTEGYWTSLPGYRLLSQTGLETIWTTGLRYPEKKIISGDAENTWRPYPGYVFKREGSLEVVAAEQATLSEDADAGPIAVVEIGLGALIEYFFGENPISNSLYQAGSKNAAKAFKAM